MRLSLLIAISTLALVGCNGFLPIAPEKAVNPEFQKRGEGSLNPSTDKLDLDCKSGKVYDACVFKKNPVAQTGGFVSLSQLEDFRDFGFKIHGLNRSGFLENARLKVTTLFTPRLSVFDASQLRREWSVEDSYVEQLSAYYWSNLTLEYLDSRVGSTRVPLVGLKVYVDDGFSGLVASNNSIHLEKKTVSIPKALSGDVVVHLLGQALANKLSEDKLFQAPTQHNFCALDPKGCCASNNGCSVALANAFGEYLVSMIFPTAPIVGEAIGQSAQGQNFCGIRRDLAVLKVRSKNDVYNACAEKGRAPLMGAWYASLWWNLRVQSEAAEAGTGQHIDKLFFDHAKAWTGSWTFTQAKAEALRLAATYENGKFLATMTTALSAL